MKIRYYVCGIGYDKNNEVTDYEVEFGDFDTYERAYNLFVKLQCRSEESFFKNASDVYELLIQLEKCEETEEEITCINVKNEWWITNPNFKEEAKMSKYGEVRNDYYDEKENKVYIDAWFTYDDNEEGIVVAKVNYKTKEVEYLDEDARTDEYVQEVIDETLKNIDDGDFTNINFKEEV